MKIDYYTVEEWKAKTGAKSSYGLAAELGINQSTIHHCLANNVMLAIYKGDVYTMRKVKAK